MIPAEAGIFFNIFLNPALVPLATAVASHTCATKLYAAMKLPGYD